MMRFTMAAVMFVQMSGIAIAAPPPRDAIEKSSDPADKRICKRFTETGSLVKGYRVCKTKVEWERSRAEARQLDTTRACGGIGADALCK